MSESVEVKVPPPRLRAVDPGNDAIVENRSEGERAVGLNIEDCRDLQVSLERSVACQRLQGKGLADVHLLDAVRVSTHHLGDVETASGTWPIHDVERVDRNMGYEIERVDQGTSGHNAAFL